MERIVENPLTALFTLITQPHFRFHHANQLLSALITHLVVPLHPVRSSVGIHIFFPCPNAIWAALPTVHICSIVPISKTVGANRIVSSVAIPHPLGDPAKSPAEELHCAGLS